MKNNSKNVTVVDTRNVALPFLAGNAIAENLGCHEQSTIVVAQTKRGYIVVCWTGRESVELTQFISNKNIATRYANEMIRMANVVADYRNAQAA
jgi:hypothetical protein